MKGKFITFEGAEGSGKSTQATMICEYLKRKKVPVKFIREPGGVKISELIRDILLDPKNTRMTDICETLLYMAARSQLVEEEILPHLEKGTTVICDRFLDSTVVYQGFGNGMDIKFIKEVGRVATKNLVPDMTLLFDIETEKGLSRTGRVKDRIERRSLDYHTRVREGYLKLAKEDPKRIKLVKVDQGKEGIHEIVQKYFNELLKLK